MVKAIVFHKQTGEILDDPDVPENDGFVINPDDPDEIRVALSYQSKNIAIDTHYARSAGGHKYRLFKIKAVEIKSDKDLIAADGSDQATIIVPAPCWVKVNGELYEAKNNNFKVSSIEAGILTIQVVGAKRSAPIEIMAETYDRVLTKAKQRLETAYKAHQDAGFIFQVGGQPIPFDSNIQSREIISSKAIRAIGGTAPAKDIFKTAHNQIIEITPDDIIGIDKALSEHLDRAFKVRENYKKQLYNLSDIRQVAGFDATEW